jgi:hypothetical protein
MKAKVLLLAGALLVSAPVARARGILFEDSLQTNLNQWVPVSICNSAPPVSCPPGGSPGSTDTAAIIAAPGGGNALTFGAFTYQGDIQTLNSFTSSTGSFTLSFDFLGNCGNPSKCGGFVNASAGPPFYNGWLLSDTPYDDGIYGVIPQIPDTGSWEHVTYTFAAPSPIYLALEILHYTGYSGPDTAWFKDMELTDDPDNVPPGTFTVSATEPVTNQFGSIALSDMTDPLGTIGATTITSTQSELTSFDGISSSKGQDLGRFNFTTGVLSSGSVSGGGVFSGTGSSITIVGQGEWLTNIPGAPTKGKLTLFTGNFVGDITWTLASKGVGGKLTYTLSGDVAGVLWDGSGVTGTTTQNIYTSEQQLSGGVAHISVGDSSLTP